MSKNREPIRVRDKKIFLFRCSGNTLEMYLSTKEKRLS